MYGLRILCCSGIHWMEIERQPNKKIHHFDLNYLLVVSRWIVCYLFSIFSFLSLSLRFYFVYRFSYLHSDYLLFVIGMPSASYRLISCVFFLFLCWLLSGTAAATVAAEATRFTFLMEKKETNATEKRKKSWFQSTDDFNRIQIYDQNERIKWAHKKSKHFVWTAHSHDSCSHTHLGSP